MKIVETNIDVYTGPMWLFEMFNEFKHPSKPSMLKPVIDPDGDPIIGIQVLEDPDWDYLEGVEVFSKLIRDHITIKKYKYVEEEY